MSRTHADAAWLFVENQYFPSEPFQPKFPAHIGDVDYTVTREYAELLRVLGLLNENTSNGLSLSDFVHQNTVFAFSFSQQPYNQAGVFEPRPDTGYLKITASLEAPPSENAQLW